MSIGDFTLFLGLAATFTSALSAFLNSLGQFKHKSLEVDDFRSFIEFKVEEEGDFLPVPDCDGYTFEFRNVSFTYPNQTTKALDNVSFVLNPGDSLAIVGENGAGKTTLIKLLIGAYEPSDGVILINDQPFSRIDRESYLGQLGALFQDYARYEFATLGENVWFGDVDKKYDKKAVREALKDADLQDLAEKYEKGLDQIMSKDFDEKYTTDLSGGQWQRLSIARAFFRSPNVLLLDEPTAAVDAKSEYEIFQNIIKKQQGKSTIIISHRFSTVRKAQQIIVLDKGTITESGTHEELLAQNGTYAEMFKLQAEGYN